MIREKEDCMMICVIRMCGKVDKEIKGELSFYAYMRIGEFCELICV